MIRVPEKDQDDLYRAMVEQVEKERVKEQYNKEMQERMRKGGGRA